MAPSEFYGIAAAGRPVLFIGDQDGEIANIIRSAKCGITVQHGDWEKFVAEIHNLVDNRKLCGKMGKNARKIFEERFDKQHAMKAWKHLLAEIQLGTT